MVDEGTGERARGAAAERERSVDRLVAFTDAVVAIALTLLVLPLVDRAGSILDHHQNVGHALAQHWFDFVAFVLSFVVIARLWVVQHRIAQDLRQANGVVYVLLMAWTLTVVFLPFPTALLAAGNSDRLVHALYVGTIAVSMFVLAALAVLLARSPGLQEPGATNHVPGTIANSLLLVLALVLSVAVPVLAYYPLFLLVLDGRLEALGRRLRRRD